MSTCGEVGSEGAYPHQGARHQTGRAQVGDTLERVPASGGGDGSNTSSDGDSLLFYRRHFHSARVVFSADMVRALTGTRQPRSQGPVSVHAHCIEGGSEEREEVNRAGGGIGVGGGNRDGNGVGGGNGNGSGDGDGAGGGMECERERGWRRANKHEMETGTGRGQGGNGSGGGDPWTNTKMGTGTGAGTETRAVAEMGVGTGREQERGWR